MARGRKIVVVDPELPVPFAEVVVLLDALDAGADCAIASRALEDSEIERDPPFLRRVSEGMLRVAARCLVHPGVRDTFCGAHAFLRNCGRAVAERGHSTGPGYAAEWIAIAQRLGLHVVEVPVRWASPQLGQTRIAFLPTLRELARAGSRLKHAEYLSPLSAQQTLADTSFVRAEQATSLWRSKFQPEALLRPTRTRTAPGSSPTR